MTEYAEMKFTEQYEPIRRKDGKVIRTFFSPEGVVRVEIEQPEEIFGRNIYYSREEICLLGGTGTILWGIEAIRAVLIGADEELLADPNINVLTQKVQDLKKVWDQIPHLIREGLQT